MSYSFNDNVIIQVIAFVAFICKIQTVNSLCENEGMKAVLIYMVGEESKNINPRLTSQPGEDSINFKIKI